MQFQGKKIGFTTTAAQLGNTLVLTEMERMIAHGAELFIIILSDDSGDIFEGPVKYTCLDLLVVVSGFPGLLEHLYRLAPGDHLPVPLVLLLNPSPGEKPALLQLSSLMERKDVYIVPFGPLGTNRQEGDDLPLFCSRVDLLGEACAAALEGLRLRPFFWEDHQFPH